MWGDDETMKINNSGLVQTREGYSKTILEFDGISQTPPQLESAAKKTAKITDSTKNKAYWNNRIKERHMFLEEGEDW